MFKTTLDSSLQSSPPSLDISLESCPTVQAFRFSGENRARRSATVLSLVIDKQLTKDPGN